ncbi:hypothetical protein BDAP_001621 [Binucleata daphniae]
MLFLLSVVKCYFFRIKLADEGKYLQKNTTEKDTVFLGEYRNSEVYEIDYNQNKPHLKWLNPQKSGDKALGYDKKSNEIRNVKMEKDRVDQLFQFIPIDLHKKTFWIVYKDKCVTYKVKDQNMILEPCYDAASEQLFQFEAIQDASDQKAALDDILNTMKDPGHTKLLKKDIRIRVVESLINNNKSNLLSAYKGLYDLALCLGNKGFCTAAEKSSYTESSVVIKSTNK